MLITEVKRDMEETLDAIEQEPVELRQQAHYWRAQHGRACERERALKERIQELEAKVREYEKKLRDGDGVIAALKAKLKQLLSMVFGRKSEKPKPNEDSDPSGGDSAKDEGEVSNKRRRGKKRGDKGFGRRRREELPTEIVYHPPG